MITTKQDITNKALKRRIIEISYKNKLSHLGSCLTAVDIIKEIYDVKKPDEKFVLSSGHAGLALYVVLEQKGGRNAEEILNHHGIHPDRCSDCGLDCSTGSLGQGLPIAVGLALADRNTNVYCLISDGECAEGSIWEALRIREELQLFNLKIYLNYNTFGAYRRINHVALFDQLNGFVPKKYIYSEESKVQVVLTNVYQLTFLKGQDAHYYTMTDEDYKEAMEILK
jgi:transketolase